MSLYAFHLEQISSTVLGYIQTMADNMAYVPKPESGTKRPKMTTPRNGACDIALSTKSLKPHIFEVLMMFRMVAFRCGHWGVKNV